MKKLIIFLMVFLYAENFNDFRNQQIQGFQNYKVSLNKEFKEYKEALNKGFADYKKSLSKYWKNPELSTKKTFVEYSKDKKVRKKVDYDKKMVTVQVIAKNRQEAQKKLKNALVALSTETTNKAFNNNPVLKKVSKTLSTKLKNIVTSAPSKELVVGDMIYNGNPTKEKIKKFVDKSLHKKLEVKKAKVPNNFVYTLNIALPSDSILIKAKRYKNDVFQKAEKFDLTPSFIYAIIQTESSFNPMARSYIPAFGLMQIVPQSAGKDAYEFLYHKKKILSPEYLYNSHNNILIGSAYLHKLYYVYFKGVKNPVSRLYCSIAAYNTGAGNVACAFNSTSRNYKGRVICKRSRGDYRISKAVSKINSMSSKEVYNYLINNLKYDEARNYLKRVMSRYILYLHSLRANKL